MRGEPAGLADMNDRRFPNAVAARAFSLVELVVVIVIIGILASVAIPRLSRGSAGARDAALDADLAIIRRAINRYYVEHGNKYPGPSEPRFVAQMTQYTDSVGNAQSSRDGTYMYGPYLLSIPPAPTGVNEGDNGVLIDLVNSPPRANPASSKGWVYNPNTGEFYLNDGVIPQPPDVGVGATGDLVLGT